MDIQQILMNILQNYYGIILVLVGFGVYAIFQRQNAKKIVLGLMLQLEKQAEVLALLTDEAKFEFVVDKGYQLIPASARVFISPATFKVLAQGLYDEAKKLIQQYVPADTTTQTVEPSIPVEQVTPAQVVSEQAQIQSTPVLESSQDQQI